MEGVPPKAVEGAGVEDAPKEKGAGAVAVEVVVPKDGFGVDEPIV